MGANQQEKANRNRPKSVAGFCRRFDALDQHFEVGYTSLLTGFKFKIFVLIARTRAFALAGSAFA